MVWPRGRPSDKPECGYNNELCDWLVNGTRSTSKIALWIKRSSQFFMFPFGSTTLLCRRRDRPAGSAGDLACHRRAGGHVHRGPPAAEVTTPDEARWLQLVADQLQRHHHHQGALGTLSTAHTSAWGPPAWGPPPGRFFSVGVLRCLCVCSSVGVSGFVSDHHDQSVLRLPVRRLQRQLRPEGQDGQGTHLHHHRPLPGTRRRFKAPSFHTATCAFLSRTKCFSLIGK